VSRALGSLQRDIKEVLASPLASPTCGNGSSPALAAAERTPCGQRGNAPCDAPSRDWSTGARYYQRQWRGLAIRAATPPSNVSLALPGRL
jgi:hypothetical protein